VSLIAIIGLLLGSSVLTAFTTSMFLLPKTRAEAAKAAAEAGKTTDERWQGWAAELEERVSKLEGILVKERRVLRAIWRWALGMRDHLIRVGETPADAPQEALDYIEGEDGPLL
jgi:hypothetical protein